MGLFDSLFGRDDTDPRDVIPDAVRFRLAPGSQENLFGGIQSLIDTFEARRRGEDQFDFLKFVFEPQLNRLNQAFGRGFIGDEGAAGALGRRRGALGQLEADLQRRGLFDSGVSGVLQAQLEADRAAKEADLFGQAKVAQRADIDAALANLSQLFPQRFEVQQIPEQVRFFNEQQRRGVQAQRAQFAQRQAAQNRSNLFSGLIGIGSLAAAPFTGGASLAIPGAASGLFGGGGPSRTNPSIPTGFGGPLAFQTGLFGGL